MENMVKCDCCEEEFDQEDLTEINGEFVCEDCISDNFIICEDCGEYIENDNIVGTGNGDTVCEDCLESHYTKCNDCDEYFPNNTIYSDGNIHLCCDCRDVYIECENCGDFVHEYNCYCYDNSSYCEHCHEQIERNDIHDYDYKPDPIFYGKGKKFFGIELEIDGGGKDGERAKTITEDINYCDHVYCKHDGSLNDGFEIVTHPMTYDYIINIKNDFQTMLENAKDQGYSSHDVNTCGLHIHISRDFFGEYEDQQDLHIAKVLFLVEKHWEKIVKFSRRTEAQLNRWAARYCEEGDPIDSEDILEKAKNSGRYHAVNLENEHTIEFRLFRGTLKFNTFMATIQFINHITFLAKNSSLQDVQALTWKQITNKTHEEYAELVQYLTERDLLK